MTVIFDETAFEIDVTPGPENEPLKLGGVGVEVMKLYPAGVKDQSAHLVCPKELMVPPK